MVLTLGPLMLMAGWYALWGLWLGSARSAAAVSLGPMRIGVMLEVR
jgi:hypothetical protein